MAADLVSPRHAAQAAASGPERRRALLRRAWGTTRRGSRNGETDGDRHPRALLLAPIAPRPATRAELLRFHSEPYVESVAAVDGWAALGTSAFVGPGTYDIALLSAGGVIAATDAEVAAEFAGDRLVVVHEGGYSSFHVPFCGLTCSSR